MSLAYGQSSHWISYMSFQKMGCWIFGAALTIAAMGPGSELNAQQGGSASYFGQDARPNRYLPDARQLKRGELVYSLDQAWLPMRASQRKCTLH